MLDDYNKFLLQLTEVNTESRIDLIHNNPFGFSKEQIDDDFFKLLEDICRDKLIKVFNTKSPLKQKMLKVQATEWLNKFIGDIKETAKLIEVYSVKENPIEIYNLRELLELRKNISDKYLVKGLIPLGGLFLLVAAPKAGKSLMATDLAVSVMLGNSFLNRETLESNVLYIQNEEPLGRTTAKRVYDKGLQQLELHNPDLFQKLLDSNKLYVVRNLDIIVHQDKLIDNIKELNVKLILIDSLGASIKLSGINEKSDDLIPHLYAIQQIAHNTDVTIVILHHATKMDNQDSQQGMISGVAGNNGIMRANDGVYRLFPPVKDSKLTTFTTILRDSGQITLGLQVKQGEANYWHWDVVNETILSPKNIELQNQILRLLFDRWNEWKFNYPEIDEETPRVYGLTLDELIALTEQDKDEIIARLNDMLSTEAIIYYPHYESKKYVYAIDESGESWLTYYLEREEENKKVSEQKLLEDKLKKKQLDELVNKVKGFIIENNIIELTKLLKTLSRQEGVDVRKRLTVDETEQLELIYNPPDIKIGTNVRVIDENISGKIIKVTFVKKDKKGYHMYSIENNPTRTFKLEQLILYENQTDSTGIISRIDSQ